jgi:hypothetical protein
VQGILDLGVSYTCLMKADKVALTDAIDYSYTDKYTWLDTFQNPDVSFVYILTKNALQLFFLTRFFRMWILNLF